MENKGYEDGGADEKIVSDGKLSNGVNHRNVEFVNEEDNRPNSGGSKQSPKNKVEPLDDKVFYIETDPDKFEDNQQVHRDKKPLRYVQWITDRPGLWFGRFPNSYIYIFAPCLSESVIVLSVCVCLALTDEWTDIPA